MQLGLLDPLVATSIVSKFEIIRIHGC
jgi:hypothetical protein